MSGVGLLAFHALGVAQMYYTYHQHRTFVFDLSAKDDFAGSYKFLTFLNILNQLIYFSLAFSVDLLNLIGLKVTKLNKLRDYYFASLSFPFAMLVVSTFWLIWAVDRELVYPSSLDDIIPSYVNHLMHTVILTCGVEYLITTHSYPQRKNGFTCSIIAGLAYFAWISYVKSVTGRWPYPFMKLLDAKFFTLFLLVIAALLYLFYVIGEKLNTSPSSAAAAASSGIKKRKKKLR